MAAANFQLSLELTRDDAEIVCGVDEAGRGPLAGPVVAAAVILDPDKPIAGLADSKALTAAKRERLFARIVADARAWHVAQASVAEIDALNILQATMLAMRRAVEGLAVAPTQALIDGNRCPTLTIAAQAIVKGDAKVAAISAASILAKVTRDRLMAELDAQWPQYGFALHSGYPTPSHLDALGRFGPCPEHRTTFGPVRDALARRGIR